MCIHCVDFWMIFSPLVGDAMEKIVKDQEEFEKEHQFMQVHITGCPDFYLFILKTSSKKSRF